MLGRMSKSARQHASKKSPAQLQREINEALAKPADGDAAGIAKRLTQRDRSTLAWIIEDWPWPYRGYAEADMARLHALGLVEPTTGDTWGGPTALGRAVWKRARKTWIDEHGIGAAFRRKSTAHSAKKMKASDFTKLATATSIPGIEKYINEFAYSTNYRVDPDTLQITNPVKAPPESWFVMPYRGGYLFGRKN